MDVLLQAFKAIAPHLSNPLVLIGFVLLLFFSLHRTLLKAGIIPPLSTRTGGKVVQILLRYGFVVALVIIVLGFTIQFYKTHRETQPPIDTELIIDQLMTGHREELARTRDEVEDWKQQAREAVKVLANLRGQPDAPPQINQALRMLEAGQTEKAEAIFQTIAKRKEEDILEAAAAYRHLGALAFLGNTQNALAAYRRATELDPDNAWGWNHLGRLLRRVGALDEAEAAYLKVKASGEAKDNQALIATAYGNLGIIYRIRGDLDQAEAMSKKGLAIEKALGRKEGIASEYGNLGLVYRARGDLDQAEAMYKKSLAINEDLGHKEGMAIQYNNLGIIYRIRGDLDQAEAMFKRSLETYRDAGAATQVERVQKLLERLRQSG